MHTDLLFQKSQDYSVVEPNLLLLILMQSRLRKYTSLMIHKKRYIFKDLV